MKIEALILAAGKGTRMKSDDKSKVMHNIAGYPMIGFIAETVSKIADYSHFIVGHRKEEVEFFINSEFPGASFSFQEITDGTGGAVRSAIGNMRADTTHVLILCGDAPLIKKETLGSLVLSFTEENADMALLTTRLEEPAHYGRIKRNKNGNIKRIVEYIDADNEERKIKEINSGVYFIKRELLEKSISKLTNHNKKNEYYLTDIVEISYNEGNKIISVIEEDFFSLSGINNRLELSLADAEIERRIKNELMISGVTLISPETIYVEKKSIIDENTTIYPFVFIGNFAVIGKNCVISPHSFVNSKIPSDTVLEPNSTK